MKSFQSECVWKQDSLFHGLPVHGAAAPNPAKLSQLDRIEFPLNPPGDFTPPVPQGSGGFFLSNPTQKTSYLK